MGPGGSLWAAGPMSGESDLPFAEICPGRLAPRHLRVALFQRERDPSGAEDPFRRAMALIRRARRTFLERFERLHSRKAFAESG